MLVWFLLLGLALLLSVMSFRIEVEISSGFDSKSIVLELVVLSIVGKVLLTTGFIGVGRSGITNPFNLDALCFLVSSNEDSIRLALDLKSDPLVEVEEVEEGKSLVEPREVKRR